MASINAHDLVCDVLQKYPAAWAVFERHGMCEDCKTAPPPVPIQHFVDQHCNGNIFEFLQEIQHAIQS